MIKWMQVILNEQTHKIHSNSDDFTMPDSQKKNPKNNLTGETLTHEDMFIVFRQYLRELDLKKTKYSVFNFKPREITCR